MRTPVLIAAALAVALIPPTAAALSIDEIKRLMIEASVEAWPGNCPCPENRDQAGRRCGKRSAWSRPGGGSPLCYPTDISDAEALDWARRQGLE